MSRTFQTGKGDAHYRGRILAEAIQHIFVDAEEHQVVQSDLPHCATVTPRVTWVLTLTYSVDQQNLNYPQSYSSTHLYLSQIPNLSVSLISLSL